MGHKAKAQGPQANERKSSKHQHSTDDENDNGSGPKDPKKPTFMEMKATEEDVKTALGRALKVLNAITLAR